MIPRVVLLVQFSVLLSACGDGTESPPAVRQTLEAPQGDTQSPAVSGYATYQAFCASCHETGAGNAPVTGNRADWENRSRLWVAVLTEHAKAGYLEMPAKGGAAGLSDLSVNHAVEYMMLKTFPEKPSG
ncbi:MAG: c-type cytochrome [Pseudomonadales bacterium]